MSTRSARLSAVGILLCMLLPPTSIAADAPATPPTSRLESLLTAHDVRYAIRAQRASSSECLHTEAERGR